VIDLLKAELGESPQSSSASPSGTEQQSLMFVSVILQEYLHASAKLHDAGRPNPLFKIAHAISEDRFPVNRIFFHLMDDLGRY